MTAVEEAAGAAAAPRPTAGTRTAVLGIRHHGPGSARSVLAELDRLRPEMVLIEGPADAEPLLGLVARPGMLPPVALLAYAPDDSRVSAFWPYAVFSPEWQAMRWAAEHGVPVRFCDLPSTMVLARPDGPPDGAIPDGALPDGALPDGELPEGDLRDDDTDDVSRIRSDPIALLAEAAGYDDAERWWDDVVEFRLDGGSPFEALTDAMAQLRAAAPARPTGEQLREDRREAWMRQTLRAALKETSGTVAVVCGAWHSPALAGTLPPANADAAVLRGAPKRKTSLAWVPWTHSRLAYASGYGAGVESPGWYHHLFTAPDQPIPRWLTQVAAVLRGHDLVVSTAHVIEAVRLADTLAALRGRPLPGLAEVNEATRSVMCEGDDVAAAFVTRELVVGEALGAVPDDAPLVPLEVDLRAQARTLRLKLDPLEKTLALDLRRDTDRARSVLLHRLAALGIGWGAVTDDAVRGTGTFHETWSLCWRPEFAVAIVEAARWGTTVRTAATTKVADVTRRAGDLAEITAAVETVLLADLADALPDVLAALDARAALDADVVHLMAAVPALVRAVRYGDVRGTDTTALAAVVDALTVRVCAALPAAVGGLGDDAAAELRRHVDAMQAAVTLYAQDEAGRPGRDRWLATLTQLAERRDVHGLLAGRLTRVLLDAGCLERSSAATRFAANLSVGVGALEKAAWAEGFLAGGGLLLVHDPELLTVLDEWLASLGPDDFVDVLPLLRRTFGTYSPPERAHIGEAVRHLGRGTVPSRGTDEALDEDRAARVLATVASILRGRR